MSDDIIFKLTAGIFKTLSHPARIKILRILEREERCVCEIIEVLDIEQSNLSQHLSILKKQGIIDSRKDGQKVIYRIVSKSVLDLINAAEKMLGEQIGYNQGILKYLK